MTSSTRSAAVPKPIPWLSCPYLLILNAALLLLCCMQSSCCAVAVAWRFTSGILAPDASAAAGCQHRRTEHSARQKRLHWPITRLEKNPSQLHAGLSVVDFGGTTTQQLTAGIRSKDCQLHVGLCKPAPPWTSDRRKVEHVGL